MKKNRTYVCIESRTERCKTCLEFQRGRVYAKLIVFNYRVVYVQRPRHYEYKGGTYGTCTCTFEEHYVSEEYV